MLDQRPCRAPRLPSPPRPAQTRALEDLRFIRETMERSASFTAASGWGQMVIGLTAFPAAWVASRQVSAASWIGVWLSEATLALAIAIAAMQIKARYAGLPITSGPGRKFALSFLPPLAVGAVLTLVFYRTGLTPALPGMWLLLYGTGVVTGGAFSVPVVPIMGLCFMLAGMGALLTPAAWGNWWMAAGFGGLHLIFGPWIARKHGG